MAILPDNIRNKSTCDLHNILYNDIDKLNHL